MRKNITILIAFAAVLNFSCMKPAEKLTRSMVDEEMSFAASQYKILMKNTLADVMPRNFNPASGKFETSSTSWWTSGFYPGTLWLIYKATKDPVIKEEAEKRLVLLEKEKTFVGNHDIGFMIFCSFGNAYDITKKAEYKDVIMTAAESATKRYKPSINAIQSWNKNNKFNCPVIIDNLMNLELLEWAYQNGGKKEYHEIALNHANTTKRNHYRADNSTYHVIDYDLATGNVIGRLNHQGYNDESAWSRGQAWGLYGFTMMYRFTKNEAYLKHAHNIASFILNHKHMPDDKIPYWDFDVPEIKTNPASVERDASAGAITASALLELAQYSQGAQKKKYIKDATTMIHSLSTKYRSAPGANKGFILQNSVGYKLANSEVNVSLTYADYYYIEALERYKKWVL